MSPLPTQMESRWADRAEPQPGKGTFYWHMLVGRYPQARAFAQQVRDRLAPFSGLHYTPSKWLHMTTLVAGPTDDISLDQGHAMLTEVSRLLADVPPITVTLGRILYHPQAIMLGVESASELKPIHDAVQTATETLTGHPGHTEGPATWTPHITIAYSTANQPAAPLIEALGPSLPARELTLDSVSLVVQHGPERLWNWQHIGSALLLGETDPL
ncbi:2'-5' RNA ligase family protein [Nonomuraea muscovyensis]|uniref:2'-5' RNA ligase family protein n=1 Tax=Nonomuraea muscovyensis TaxID=1124761 RepID=UPI0033FF9852